MPCRTALLPSVAALSMGCAAAGAGTAGADERSADVTVLGRTQAPITVGGPVGMLVSEVHLPGALLPLISVTEHEPAPASPDPAPVTKLKPAPAAGPSATGEPVRPGRMGGRLAGRRLRPTRAATPTLSRGATAIRRRATRLRASDGTPRAADPTFSFAVPGPAPVGVPDFFIEKFRIPPFLLPIYQAAGTQYGVRWEVLAAINEIETDYGRNLAVSTAGAQGWMQFMPATWAEYGVDANGDGDKDPYNAVDAIFTAARYLKSAGAAKDIRRAVYAYNHADWYVDSVLMRARLIGGAPAELIGSLTGLTLGRFPVAARARYAQGARATNIFARPGAAVIAVQDGTVTGIGRSARLGRYVRLRDVYSNTYTYARLARVARTYSVPRAAATRLLQLPAHDPAPVDAASAGTQVAEDPSVTAPTGTATARTSPSPSRVVAARPGPSPKQRLFAHPPELRPGAAATSPRTESTRRLRVGSRVTGGTVLGRIGSLPDGTAAHVRFGIRPAGRRMPAVDPKPILDGWKLLESTAVYRARGTNPLLATDAEAPHIGRILLMTKAQLQRTVLRDPRITLAARGRDDVRTGQIDRRVLATLEFLAASGLKPTVTSLKGGHRTRTTSGAVSEHATGNGVDIAAIDGIPILGHQGPGSITDITVRRLLTLQGSLQPHQIISLMTIKGASNTLALPDHDDHIHIGFRPDAVGALSPVQWIRLIRRLAAIENPSVAGDR